MSEYQYYEFRAMDRPLTESEMAELRAISSRAEITPTRFQNEYNYGDFRGDPLTLMQKYFDAFVYVTNWGTRTFMLRLPVSLLPRETADEYALEPGLLVHESGDNIILEYSLDEEEPEWAEGETWLDSLLPLRDDIAGGDLRSLYVGWLGSIWLDVGEGDEEDDVLREPPVPAGLKELTPWLRKLAEFLVVDQDLIAAAERSRADAHTSETFEEWERWLRRLDAGEKDALLLQVMQGEGMAVRARLQQRFRQDMPRPALTTGGERRTVAELFREAERLGKERRQREEARAAEERERRARKEHAAREKYLGDLAGRKEATWTRIETLLATRRGPEYDQAAQYVRDLREVALREGAMADFTTRLHQLRTQHAGKQAFIRRLDAAKLR